MTALTQSRMEDHIGLFVDEGYQVINGPAIVGIAKRAGYRVAKFAKVMGVTRNYLYLDKLRVNDEVREQVIDLVRIVDNAYKISGGDLEEVKSWLVAPNPGYLNQSPFQMAFAGKGKTVYEEQERLLGT